MSILVGRHGHHVVLDVVKEHNHAIAHAFRYPIRLKHVIHAKESVLKLKSVLNLPVKVGR